jgi:hypothetical protein
VIETEVVPAPLTGWRRVLRWVLLTLDFLGFFWGFFLTISILAPTHNVLVPYRHEIDLVIIFAGVAYFAFRWWLSPAAYRPRRQLFLRGNLMLISGLHRHAYLHGERRVAGARVLGFDDARPLGR